MPSHPPPLFNIGCSKAADGRPNTLLVGDFDRAELRPIVAFLKSTAADHHLIGCERSVAAAIDRTAASQHVDRILIAPAFRDQIRLRSALKLVERFPAASLWLLVGSWLEGETRSGDAWELDKLGAPNAFRVYVDQFIPRWRHHIGRGKAASKDADRPTQGRTERRPNLARGVAAVCSDMAAHRSFLAELLEDHSWPVLTCSLDTLPSSSAVSVAVYDAAPQTTQQDRDLRNLTRAFPAARLTVISSFPRWDETKRWIERGAHQVLGKPFNIRDLLNCIESETPLDVHDASSAPDMSFRPPSATQQEPAQPTLPTGSNAADASNPRRRSA